MGSLLVGGGQPLDDQLSARSRWTISRRSVVQRWPGGAGRGEDDALQGEVEVGGRGDDGGVVAAELQQAAAEAGRDAGADLAAHARRAGGAERARRAGRPPAARRRRGRRAAAGARRGARRRPRRPGPAAASQARAISGVSSAGFQTTVSPQTSATAVFQDHTAAGKLNAEMTPTTPSGCQVSARRWPGRSEAMVRPYSWRDRPTAKSQMSIISWTSPSASERILPASMVTRSARSPLCSRSSSPQRLTSCAAARRRGRRARSGTPRRPAAMAASVSAPVCGRRPKRILAGDGGAGVGVAGALGAGSTPMCSRARAGVGGEVVGGGQGGAGHDVFLGSAVSVGQSSGGRWRRPSCCAAAVEGAVCCAA